VFLSLRQQVNEYPGWVTLGARKGRCPQAAATNRCIDHGTRRGRDLPRDYFLAGRCPTALQLIPETEDLATARQRLEHYALARVVVARGRGDASAHFAKCLDPIAA
jgi:hypothetical protein